MQNNTTEDEKNDDVEEPEEEDKNAAPAHIEVTLPEDQPLDSNFSDAGYWKVESCESDLDDLLADYEWTYQTHEAPRLTNSFAKVSLTVDWPFACSLALRGELSQ